MSSLIYLASTSPRRREILETLGIDFDVIRVETDESPLQGETPGEMVLRLAVAKADAATHGEFVLAADTIVVLGDRVLGKPRDADDGVEMLLALSGRSHAVMTGVALKTPTETRSVLSTTDVQFAKLVGTKRFVTGKVGSPATKPVPTVFRGSVACS